jgi:hypothetical protein
MAKTSERPERFSIRLIHLNHGWRYMVLDRSKHSDFLADDSGKDLDFGTEDEARTAIAARFGSAHAQQAALRGVAARA